MWRIFSAKSASPRRPSPSLAGRTTSRRCVSKAATAARAVAAAAVRRGTTASHRGIGRRGGVGGRQRVGDEFLDAADLAERRLRLEPGDRAAGMPDQRLACRLDHGRQRLQTPGGGGEAVGERRELARLETEQALADEVDPFERVPGVLGEDGLAEPRRLELADDQVAVDRVVGREVGHRPERREPAVGRRESLGAAGRGQIRPAAVMGVLADHRREDRFALEGLGEEGRDGPGEVRHPAKTPISVRSSRKSQPRVSPGSIRATVPPRSSS